MAIIQKIKSFFTRKGESKSASDKDIKTEQSKMEKANNVDDTKDGKKNEADLQPVGKRTVWQRLKDKVRKTYSHNKPMMNSLSSVIGVSILGMVLIPSFEILGLLVNPYFFIPFGFCSLILIVITVLSEINRYKMKQNKNKMK